MIDRNCLYHYGVKGMRWRRGKYSKWVDSTKYSDKNYYYKNKGFLGRARIKENRSNKKKNRKNHGKYLINTKYVNRAMLSAVDKFMENTFGFSTPKRYRGYIINDTVRLKKK